MTEQPYVEYMQNVADRLDWASCQACGKRYRRNHTKRMYCDDCGVAPLHRGKYIIFLRDKFSCIYCGASPIHNSSAMLEAEHVIPYSRGGTNQARNIVTACHECNASKVNNELPEDILNTILTEVARRNEKEGIDPLIEIKRVR